MFARLRPTSAAALLACAAIGCAPLRHAPSEGVQLPRHRLASDSIVLEVAFVRFPAGQLDPADAVWLAADEQQLAVESRRRLADNGLRCGLLGSQLPPELRELLDAAASPLGPGTDVGISADAATATQQRLPLRAGNLGRIVLGSTHDLLHVLTQEEGELRGETYREARCELAVRSYPQGDGRVRLEFTPEIHHGQPRQRYLGGQGGIRVESRQDERVFERLRFDATLSPGQILVFGPTLPGKGLGGCFFASPGDEQPGRLLLVRLAQTQLDDLFAPEQVAAPLATPFD